MIPFTIEKRIGEAGVFFTSESVRVEHEDFADVTVSNGTLVVNGTDTGSTSARVADGSFVAVRLQSSMIPGRAVYSILTIDRRSAPFVVITNVSAQRVYQFSNNRLPLDFYGTAALKNDVSWQFRDSPMLHKMDGLFRLSGVDLTQEPTKDLLKTTQTVIVNRWGNKLYIVDPVSDTVSFSLDVLDPIAVCSYEQAVEGAASLFFLLVLCGDGHVYAYSAQNEFASAFDSFYVGAEPSDMDGSDGEYWIALKTGVVRLNLSENLQFSSTPVFNTDGLPGTVRAGTDYVFVSLFLSDVVLKVRKADLQTAMFNVGRRPYGLCVDAQDVAHCVCSADATVWRVGIDSTQVALLSLLAPTHIIIDNGRYIVLDIESKKAARYDESFNRLLTYNASSPIEMYSGQFNYLLTNGRNVHTRLEPVHFFPENFEFTPSLGQDVGTEVTSNSYIVRGLNSSAFVSVPQEHNAVVLVNGVPGDTVVNGDTVRVRVTSPELYDSSQRTLVVLGGASAYFTVNTVDQSAIPDSIVFSTYTGAQASHTYVSNIVTVTGMAEGAAIEAHVENAELIVNGSTAESGSLIRNGDLIALRVTTDEENLWFNGLLNVGPIQAVFSVVVDEEECTGRDFNLPIKEQRLKSDVYSASFSMEVDGTIEISGVYASTIIVNGEYKGVVATVVEGDVVSFKASSTALWSLRHQIHIKVCDSLSVWEFITEPDRTPDYIEFPAVRGKLVGESAVSELRTITGILPSVEAYARISPDAAVILNGQIFNEKEDYNENPHFDFLVQADDTIEIVGRAGTPFGTARLYTLTIGEMSTEFRVYSLPLEGVYENPKNLYPVKSSADGFVHKPHALTVPFSTLAELSDSSSHVTNALTGLPSKRYPDEVSPVFNWETNTISLQEIEGGDWYPTGQKLQEIEGGDWYPTGQKLQEIESADWNVRFVKKHLSDANAPVRISNNISTWDGSVVEKTTHNLNDFNVSEATGYYSNKVLLDLLLPKLRAKIFVEQGDLSEAHRLLKASAIKAIGKSVGFDNTSYTVQPIDGTSFEKVWPSVPHLFSAEVWRYFPYSVEEVRVGFHSHRHHNWTDKEVGIFGFDKKIKEMYTFDIEGAWKKQILTWNVAMEFALSTFGPSYPVGQELFRKPNRWRLIGAMGPGYSKHDANTTVMLDPERTTPFYHYVNMEARISLRPTLIYSDMSSVGLMRFGTSDYRFARNPEQYTSPVHVTDSLTGERLSPPSDVSTDPLSPVPTRKLSTEKDTSRPQRRANMIVAASSSSADKSNAVFTAVEKNGIERNRNDTFDVDHNSTPPTSFKYLATEQDARQAALDAGIPAIRIQTHELYPGSWVYAETLDYPSLCDVQPDDPESGWIQGG